MISAARVGPEAGTEADGSAVIDVCGMWCSSCANAVERVLARQQGVLDARVSFSAEAAHVQWDTTQTTLETLFRAVARLGYTATLERTTRNRRAHLAREAARVRMRLIVAVVFGMWAMPAQWTLYVDAEHTIAASIRLGLAWFAGATTLPILFFSGWPFLRAAWRTLRAGAPGMDVLVACGATVAFGLSVWRLLTGNSEVFFDTTAMIVTLLLAGRLIEHAIRARASDAMQALLALPAETVLMVEPDGSRHELLAKRAVPGQRFVLRPGERAALDGQVESGTSTLDRALLTGESLPVAVSTGDVVEAGVLNGTGSLTVRVTSAVGERRADAIARTLRQMLARKTAVDALAERFTRYFVPFILMVSAATCAYGVWSGAGWSAALEHAIAVLVITCPCALGLATPMALMVGAGRAARAGILFQDVEAIERAGRIDAVFFDKTGTLTLGEPHIVGVHAEPESCEDAVLANAATAEQGSEHPLARALRRCANKIDVGVGESEAIPGMGVVWRGEDGTRIVVGSGALLAREGIAAADKPGGAGTVAFVARNGRLLGHVLLSDTPRTDAPAAIAELRARGIEIGMLTGDRTGPAMAIADAVGLPRACVRAGMSPESKAEFVANAQRAHRVVAFVGDGLNDGPALAAADYGIAVQSACASSSAAAAVVLSRGDVGQAADAIAIGQRIARVMRQNLVWAATYNLIALPVAIAGYASPALAAVAMVFSSVSVTLNACRLNALPVRRRREPPPQSPNNSSEFHLKQDFT
ncbi:MULTISPECIES: heavy metal translocating P-type ATPase [Burkholderia cepacia complex]|uniref:heavy metal translocating P-type ATPase n=1 Tax=Burkholderia cepacia complex TaxID=87882 RepID=UPI001B9DE222|nr:MULTISPECIES: cation-translocating P-type ATPase [Burkholderia cepacia complex]MBR8409044.1 cadmium-translocating P-type ATPase [Burkholderia cenocepacia]WJN72899.1 cadmium-translocating P-type ATPase [Burkholderia anthina]